MVTRRLIVLVMLLFVGLGTVVVSHKWRKGNNKERPGFEANEAQRQQQQQAEERAARWLFERDLRLKRSKRDITPVEFSGYSSFTVDEIEFTSADQVTSEVLAKVKQFSNLKEISFYDTDVGDEHMPLIASLKHIPDLNFNYTQVTNEGLAVLGKQHPKLETLRLNGTRITDEGIAHLPRGELRLLTLFDTAASDTGLAELAQFPKLARLDVQNTQVTAEGLRRFQEAKRSCFVAGDPY